MATFTCIMDLTINAEVWADAADAAERIRQATIREWPDAHGHSMEVTQAKIMGRVRAKARFTQARRQ